VSRTAVRAVARQLQRIAEASRTNIQKIKKGHVEPHVRKTTKVNTPM
jgi:hypothetical protein